ncbi:MAG TPA: ethylbenzene dehydrogenase-related protein [Xanthomonadaceae bacterium]|nr:ethylbenzene dehydrogenase-related protein [Xanthomonadaceae bacterium]
MASLAAVLAGVVAGPACAVDWNTVPETQVVLFYPGQASWEWALTERDHSGAPKFREGKDCRGCHDGEQAEMGTKIVAGGPLEPGPIAGKSGSLALGVQVARDADNLLLRLRFTGAEVSSKSMDPDVHARVTVMIGDASVKESMRAGCWASCHDDLDGMHSAPAGTELTKYLGASRNKLSRQGGGSDYKSDEALQALMAQGAFLEYWQARLNPGKPAEASSGYVLARREQHAAPVVAAQATQDGRQWTVVLTRPLQPTGTGQKKLAPGTTYAIGFAVHDDHAAHRYHFVSLEYTFALDAGEVDFVAKQQ